MNIKISKQVIGNEEVNSVSARDLHEFLEVKTHLSTWIKRAIDKYDFEENYNFSILKSANPTGGLSKLNYIITLDMAKELAMVENNHKGKQIRKYFIQCEKELRELKYLLAEQINDHCRRAEKHKLSASEWGKFGSAVLKPSKKLLNKEAKRLMKEAQRELPFLD